MSRLWFECVTTLFLLPSCALAEPRAAVAQAPNENAELPVREVACFKDGHAFVMREGPRKLDANGQTVLERLPAPVLGTFWPYATGAARVVSVTSSKERVMRERKAIELREMLEANVGAQVVVYDTNNERFEGELVGMPARETPESERNGPPGPTPKTRETGKVVLVRVTEGLRAIPLERVRDVIFKDRDARTYSFEEQADRLTIRVENGGTEAVVGLFYVQKGLRWIPSYKIDLDGEGHAAVKMEATLVNDLIDLSDVTVNLVVGVPHFEFQGQLDPIGLQQTAAEIGRAAGAADPFSNRFSNAIMSQAGGNYSGPGNSVSPAPAVEGAQQNEDLFVFNLQHITLKRGERMVVPVAEFALSYRDVYTLDADVDPPFDIQAQLGRNAHDQQNVPQRAKVVHAARLRNDSKFPLTTSPALVLAKGKILAQGMLTYTPIGATVDLELTTAVDIQVKADSAETGRVLRAERWNGNEYGRIDMSGSIELANNKTEAVDIEVRQLVLGRVDSATLDGKFEQKSAIDVWYLPHRPRWWQAWNWPWWWYRFNGVGEIKWQLRVEAGKSAKVESKWHYFWQ